MSTEKVREQARLDIERINAAFKEHGDTQRASRLAVLLVRMRCDQNGIDPTKDRLDSMLKNLMDAAEATRSSIKANEELTLSYTQT